MPSEIANGDQESGETIVAARRKLREQPNSRFVSSTEYRNLLLSRSRLQRSFDSAARVCSLVETDTGRRFLIEEEYLLHSGRRA